MTVCQPFLKTVFSFSGFDIAYAPFCCEQLNVAGRGQS